MTSCPSCGRGLQPGETGCPACGAAVPTLPAGLFRDEPAGPAAPADPAATAAATADPAATAAYRPDFLARPDPPTPTAENPPPTEPPDSESLTTTVIRNQGSAAGPPPIEPPDPGTAAGPPANLPPAVGSLTPTVVGHPQTASPPLPPQSPPALPRDLFRDVQAAPPVAGDDTGSFGFRQFGAPDTGAIPVTRATPAGWVAPPAPGNPQSDLLPSERRPPTPKPVLGRTGVILLAILALLAAAAVVGGLMWWNAPPTPQAGAVRTQTGRAPASSGAASQAPGGSSAPASAPASAASSPAAGAFPPPGATTCTPAVAVNSSTSCPFAANVAAALPAMAEGATAAVTATSPATGQTYQMICRRSGYVTCTGGSNAVVYVRVAP